MAASRNALSSGGISLAGTFVSSVSTCCPPEAGVWAAAGVGGCDCICPTMMRGRRRVPRTIEITLSSMVHLLCESSARIAMATSWSLNAERSRVNTPKKAGLSPGGDGLSRVNLCRVECSCSAVHEATTKLLLSLSPVKRGLRVCGPDSPAGSRTCGLHNPRAVGCGHSERGNDPDVEPVGASRPPRKHSTRVSVWTTPRCRGRRTAGGCRGP